MLQWASASLLTGRVIADLPSLEPQWPLRRTIGNAESAAFTLHLDGAPENWRDAVYEGGAVLFGYDDADPSLPIVWAGYVTSVDRPFKSNDLPVTAATFEAVLDRPYVGDCTFYTTDHRDDIIATILANWLTPMGVAYATDYTPGGGPTPPVMDNPPVPNAAIVMQNTDNASVKGRMDQVVGQLGGEYTVEWGWTDGGQSILPTITWGDRIGQAAQGDSPNVTFEMPGNLEDGLQTRDYSAGAGANKVVAYSSGQGSNTPYAAPVYAPQDGRPVFENRYQPAPSISPTALTQYAQQAVKVWGPGARPVTLVVNLERLDGRRLGVDWRLGDDIGYRVPSSYTNEAGETVHVLAFPDGLAGIGRAIGYERTDTTITPLLAPTSVYVAQ